MREVLHDDAIVGVGTVMVPVIIALIQTALTTQLTRATNPCDPYQRPARVWDFRRCCRRADVQKSGNVGPANEAHRQRDLRQQCLLHEAAP